MPPLCLLVLLGALAPCPLWGERPVDRVDPLIDTHQSRWFYFNSASRPFGLVNLSPDTQTKGSWKSGYLYDDTHIRCFSHLHGWQLSGLPVMPIVGEMTGHLGMDVYQSAFSHQDEVVAPGYHKVVLRDYGITAELTSTTRVGFHRYSFPKTEDAYVIFDISAYLGHSAVQMAEIKQVSSTEIEGLSIMEGTRRRKMPLPVHFVIQFNQPLTAFGGWADGRLSEEARAYSGATIGAYGRFSSNGSEPLLMKVGISYTSVEGARKNLSAELDHWDFDRVVEESDKEWNALLSRIKVSGGTEAQQTKFYTDLWRTLLGRRIMNDVDGKYLDYTTGEPKIKQVPLRQCGEPLFNMHNFDSKWGSHWSLNILWPLLAPERMSDFCATMVQMYRDGGLIPRGPSGGNYTFVMIGDSAAPFITSAFAKGIRDFDYETALEGLVRNTEADGSRYYGGYGHKPRSAAHEQYTRQGYVSPRNHLFGSHRDAVTSLTLYNSYHDWCIAEMARSIGQTEFYEKFIPGAKNYRNVIWPEKQSAWVRMEDGSWLPNFSPTVDGFAQPGFCEGNAAMATFYVPHDPLGLAELLGGPTAAAQLLDSYFEQAEPYDFKPERREGAHAQIAIGYTNQDGTGHAHYFNRIGYPWLSQKWARAVQEKVFADTGPYAGYHGDEDQGQMGALSALLAMGLFQFDGGSGPDSAYDITAPIFDEVTIQLSPYYYNGNTFRIVTRNNAPDHVYIQSATWNGQKMKSSLLLHSEVVNGGTLILELGPEPNKEWGFQP